MRENWGEQRDLVREEWRGWFNDHYGRYDAWYDGHAPGYWGQWDYLWDEYSVAAVAGLTWWSANSLACRFGLSAYHNPYYVESMPVSYAEPIVTVPIEPKTVAPERSFPLAVVHMFDQARAAFGSGRYDEALKLTNDAVAQMPHDAVLHEFRSLVLFALRRYPESAATIHAVLDVGPGWNWKTLSTLYPGVDVYVGQLRALESARDKEPKDAASRFLLGYHYLTCGYSDEALRELRSAPEQQPNDTLTGALVATLTLRDLRVAETSSGEAPKAVPQESIIGMWRGASMGTAMHSMDLHKDGTFTWGFTRGARKHEVEGVYVIDGNVLAMEPSSGGILLALMTVEKPDALQFKMIGGGSRGQRLEFRREGSSEGK